MMRRRSSTVTGMLMLCAACLVPSDRGPAVRVDVGEDQIELLLGERAMLAPVAVNTGGDALPGNFAFASSDSAVVVVNNTGSVLAVGVGEANVMVTMRTFAHAVPDTVRLRVIPDIRFDDVAPDSVRYGDTLTVIGAALDPFDLSLVAVGGVLAPVASFRASNPNMIASRDTLRVIVPVGAPASSDVVVLHQRGSSAFAPVTVVPEDRFEPNETGPARIPNAVGFADAQLALEAGVAPRDWYRLGTIDRDATIELRLGIGREFGIASVTISSPVDARGDPPLWSMRALTLQWNSDLRTQGRLFMMCRGLAAAYESSRIFFNRDFSAEVVRFPLEGVALDSLDVTVEWLNQLEEPWGYELRVLPGYVSDVAPDAFEENDFCDVAPAMVPGVHAINIDHNYDVDWFRLAVPNVPHDVSISARYRGTLALPFVDVDLVLYQDTVVGLPGAPGDLPIVATAADFAPSRFISGNVFENEVQSLVAPGVPAGDYLLLVRNAFAFPTDSVLMTVNMVPSAAGSFEAEPPRHGAPRGGRRR